MAKKNIKKTGLEKLSVKPTVKAIKTVSISKGKVKISTKIYNTVDKAVSTFRDLAVLKTFQSNLLSKDELPATKSVQRLVLKKEIDRIRDIPYHNLKPFRGPLYSKRTFLIPSPKTFYWFQVTYCSDYSPPTTSQSYLGAYGLTFTRVDSPFECFARYTFNKGVKLLAIRTKNNNVTPNTYSWGFEVGINPLVTDETPLISNISDIPDAGLTAAGLRHYWTFLIADDNPNFEYFSSLGILKPVDTSKASIIAHNFVDKDGVVCDIGWINETLKFKEYI